MNLTLTLSPEEEQVITLETGVEITYRWTPSEPEWIDLLGLQSANRGQGHASRALDALAAFADAQNLSISVYAKMWAESTGLDTLQLADWYRRHGYETGDTYLPRDDQLNDPDHIGVDMWRKPCPAK